MPPAPVRRPVTITVWLVVSIVAVALSPALLAVARILEALTGDRRWALITRILLTYFVRELSTLCACGVLWLFSGAGLLISSHRIQALHWRLLSWFVGGIAASVQRTLDIEIADDPESGPAADALHRNEPLIVLSRHAGPGDTILLIDRLLSEFGRLPSVVFKETILLDPSVDLIAYRLPQAALDADDPQECETRIARTAAALGPRGVLLIFPEGGNFSRERRRAALRSLVRHGKLAAARAGERMEHVLPPRPAGTAVALRANPEAGVVFAAHTGLGLAAYPREIWRKLPVGRTLYTRMWLVPSSEIPSDEEEVARWLNDWWSRIDGWIEAQGNEPSRRD